ncbi:hypothetical protein GCM10023191_087530 [Actinoallomurus oryzae]|uniref:Uncharacterized protein n=1 Tax=Actinoallomurus oryzae TaxID=502180 RepID=A0ABP8R2J4_9ACTN
MTLAIRKWPFGETGRRVATSATPLVAVRFRPSEVIKRAWTPVTPSAVIAAASRRSRFWSSCCRAAIAPGALAERVPATMAARARFRRTDRARRRGERIGEVVMGVDARSGGSERTIPLTSGKKGWQAVVPGSLTMAQTRANERP